MKTVFESPESTNDEPEKVDLNRFPLKRFSRWTDTKGRLLVLLGCYHGKDHSKPYSDGFDRIGVDILNVQEEQVEYMEIGRFVYFIIHNKIMPWKDQDLTFLPITEGKPE